MQESPPEPVEENFNRVENDLSEAALKVSSQDIVFKTLGIGSDVIEVLKLIGEAVADVSSRSNT